MVHPTLFKDNANLYLNKDDLKDLNEKSNVSKEETKYGNSKFKTAVQNNSSDDEDMKTDPFGKQEEVEDKPATDLFGRHVTLSLEVVLVGRIIKYSTQTVLQKLLSFDSHPRDKM